MKKICGNITPVLTPRYHGSFDEISFLDLIELHYEAGADGSFILGSAGEQMTVPSDDKKKAIRVAGEKFGNTLLIAGTACDTLEQTIDLTNFAEQNGIAAVVVMPQHIASAKPEEFMEVFEKSTNLPFIFYNIPSRTNGISLGLEMVARYSLHPRCLGAKDSSGDRGYFRGMHSLRSDTFGLLQGDGLLLKESLQTGIDGCVMGVSNISGEIARLISNIYRKSREGIFDERDFKLLETTVLQVRATEDSIKAIKELAYANKLIRSPETFSPNGAQARGTSAVTYT